MKALTYKHQGDFRADLRDDGPTDITRMEIKLDASKKPVRVNVRKYLKEQRKFLDAYFEQLVKFGLLKSNPNDFWLATPPLVAKGERKFRVAVN